MSALWTSAEAEAATGGHSTAPWEANGVSIDTRTLQPGDLFVALKDQRDGHDFVAQAFAKGAAAALVSRVPDGVSSDKPLLIVDDVLDALRGMGRAARARMSGKVIAVTGSVGKTGTKEMLRTALTPQGKVHAAEKSYNNHWGVPLTLARMPADTDYAVIEIGMNAPGEIAPLAKLARPHVAMVTTVAAVHLAAFRSVRGIAREKASIFEGLEPGGTAVINRDIKTYPTLLGKARRLGVNMLRFGYAGRPEFALDMVKVGEEATCVRAHHGREKLMFKLSAPGKHLAMNALGVLAAVEAAGADVAQAALALASWRSPEGRGARWMIELGPEGMDGSIELIDESYNANPAAMAAAFEVMAAAQPKDGVGRVKKGRRVAFLSDMLELGEDSFKLHAGLSQIDAVKQIDVIHCAGPLMKSLHDALPRGQAGEWHPDTETMAKRVRTLVDAGDVVMAKGSLGSKAGLIIEAVKKLGTPVEKVPEGQA
jgi:UDP-N-acetylmuramoyl-tripeptide--D-alanyl-D-alanine ligase